MDVPGCSFVLSILKVLNYFDLFGTPAPIVVPGE
jgi:hypothetical protein